METADYFEVAAKNGRIALTPVHVNRADGVRVNLAEPRQSAQVAGGQL